jgi:hypothetical protein
VIGNEDVMQMLTVNWLRQCTDLPFWHTANERQTSAQHGLKLKKMGVLSGVSDLIFPRGNSTFKGLVLELKVKPNKPTKSQIQFQEMMIEEGYACFICYSYDEAIQVIKAFYSSTDTKFKE